MKLKSLILLLLCAFAVGAQKPAVWIISDGGKNINDSDNDISAIAGYLLISNHFDTRAIVLGSSVQITTSNDQNLAEWALKTLGKAYAADYVNLNKYVGGYQKDILFLESSIKGMGKNFNWTEKYDIKKFPSIYLLYKELEKSKKIINVLCFGPLTEQAILVSYCLQNNKQHLLNRVRFISHWTNSNYHIRNIRHPERTPNCMGDPIACDFMKKKALNGQIKFYECGAIGQYGIVESAPKGIRFYDQFYESRLGTIYRNGAFLKERVDDSAGATYWVLLGNYGVSLSDIADNGTNPPHVEQRNEKTFALYAHEIRKELLRRSDAAAGYNPNAISIDCIVPEHGMADAHAWVQNDTLWVFCGHDMSWDPQSSFPMDRWEIWSTTDLKTWKYHRSILPKDTYIGDKPNCWAGDICERNGKYYWFFSNRNINTGVLVADRINGEYKDLLGKPLLPSDIIPGHPYDPEIFIENGVYTICFGSGRYYMATLAEDMMSLKTKPKHVLILDEKGQEYLAEDKPTLFKRKGKYYLVFGSRYAMSDNLYGPYTFKGAFLSGGHTSFFDWQGQKYVLQENHDISAFFRGISLKPVFFNEDGTIRIPKKDRWYPGPGRPFRFEYSTMGWKALSGTSLFWKDGVLAGRINEPQALIQSAPWLYTETKNCSFIIIKIKNNSYADKLKVAIYTRNKDKNFWSSYTNPIDWNKQQWITIPITSNDDEFKTYRISLDRFDEVNERLMQIAIQPAVNAYNGYWEIDEVVIE